MIIIDELEVEWAAGNKKHYESLGYKYTKIKDKLTIKVEHVPVHSSIKVPVKCDFCGEIDYYSMKSITNSRINNKKDACKNRKCILEKTKETNLSKYGVENLLNSAQFYKFHRSEPSNKLTIEHVLEVAKSKNITILDIENYKNTKSPLQIICNLHPDEGVQISSYQNINRNSKCCYYGGNELIKDKLKLNQEYVFEYFKTRGLIVEPDEKYSKKDGIIKCRCIHHPEYILKKSLNALEDTKVPCEYCRNELSIEDISNILRNTISSWSKKWEKYNNYKCIITGSSNYEVHHLYSFNLIIKDCLSELNISSFNYTAEDIIKLKKLILLKHESVKGVCIRPDLHKMFHNIYGNENNEIQFDEFKTHIKLNKIA